MAGTPVIAAGRTVTITRVNSAGNAVTFTCETMELTADQGLYLIACSAAPGSRDADALNLLASWNATDNANDTALNRT